jgi:hypothetical protein
MHSEYSTLANKLEEFCETNHLTVEYEKENFPIVFKFQSEEFSTNQTSLAGLEIHKTPTITIEFIFGDVLNVRTAENCTIDDELLSQLKNKVKKMHYLYLQIFFKQRKLDEALRKKAYHETTDGEEDDDNG